MSEAPNAAPAADAGNTPPPAAPAAAAAPAAEARHPATTELMKRLLGSVEDEPKEPKEEPAAPVAAPDAPPAAAATPAPPPAGEQPVRVRRPKAPERPPLPIPAALPASAAPAPATPPDPAWEANLEENEREMLDDARYAEQHLGPAHKGLSAKVEKFLKDHEAYTNQPDFDEQSPEYRQWLAQNQPKLTPAQQRQMMEARVTEKVRKEADVKLGDMEHKLFVRDSEPVVKTDGENFFNAVANDVIPKDIRDALANNPEQAGKDFPLEIGVINTVLNAARADVEEFRRITRLNPVTGRAMTDIASSPSDPRYEQHSRLANMVRDICVGFRDNGGQERLKGGRWFVTRDEYAALPAAEKPKYWTFSNNEIIDRARSSIPTVVQRSIQARIAENERLGFRRTPPAAPAAPVPAPPPAPVRGAPAAPRPGAIPATGGSVQSEGAKLAANLLRGQ